MSWSLPIAALLFAVQTVPPRQAEMKETQPLPPSATVPAEVPEVFALPTTLRRELPELNLSVLAWNEEPAQRFVKINGERVGEGQVAVPGEEIWVREIRRQSVVIQYQSRFFILR